MSLAPPRIGEAIELANHLVRLPWRRPSIRKECRLLTSTELQRIFDALQAAKRDTRVRPNVLDAFAFLHSHPEINEGAHGGTAFLPFHRYYLHLYEKMLRMYEPTVSLCFWDTTLEPENYEESAMWTADIFGSPRGLITEGFAANWLTPLGPLIREVAGARGRTLNDRDIEEVLRQTRIGEISFPNGITSANVEELHNHVHLVVGGLMSQIESASYDPIFWFHHTYVDCLYERFRKKQNETGKINPQRDWPRDFGDPSNAPFVPMRLGAMMNIDGANNIFSGMITCEDVPECRTDRDCGRFMNCDRIRQRCISNTRRNSQSASMFGGMFGMSTNSFGGMFQNGLFSSQGSGGFPGFNPMSFNNNGNQAFGQMNNFGNTQGGFPGGPSNMQPGLMGNQNQNFGGPPQQFQGMQGFPGAGNQGQQNMPQFPGMPGSNNMQSFPGMANFGGMMPGMPNMGGGGMPNMGGGGMPNFGGGMPNFGGGGMPNFGNQGVQGPMGFGRGMPNFGGAGGTQNQNPGMNMGPGGPPSGFNFGK
ncbi:putative tyrosinase-like protein tyr-3 [Patella vulgata]|uniref:putative tyrosinase-like protein tyr-3 n=1 Tax=Patella vulgata TaxID=6465 RepID=UPI0024A7E920|nr:putative tyrosinase-like protein tyr-3 [Patella vulgata]